MLLQVQSRDLRQFTIDKKGSYTNANVVNSAFQSESAKRANGQDEEVEQALPQRILLTRPFPR